MKFLSFFLLIQGLIVTFQAINLEPDTKLNSFSTLVETDQEIFVDTDYSKAFFAYQKLSQISSDYQSFKDRIAQNTTIEYNKCKDALETLQCYNVDQWHSVISELKMINSNSESVEIPFLVERKEKKIEKLKGLVAETEVQNKDLEELMTMLQKNQAQIIQNSKEINAMYKLPYHPQYNEFVQMRAEPPKEEAKTEEAPKEEAKTEEAPKEEAKKEEAPKEEAKTEEAPKEEAKKEEAPKGEAKAEEAPKEEEKKEEENVPEQLNNDVPDVANEQLSKAKQEYDIADESIQASAASNIFMQYSKKVSETIHHLNEAYELKFNELRMNKEQLKEDIVRARVLISNEKQIQERNEGKITELKQRIEECKGMPTNLEKDCEPMRVTASKLTTEIEIIQGRTDHLHGQLKFLVLNNMHQSTILELVPPEQQTDDIQELLNPPKQFVPRKPQELEPKNHYSSEDEEEKATEQPAKTEEPAKEEAPKEEPKKEEAPKEEPKKEEAPKEEPKKEEAPKEEPSKEEK